MDPNATLNEIRRLIVEVRISENILEPTEFDDEYMMRLGVDLADAFDSLDYWISKGGFLPDQWSQERVGYTS